jgi:hypothetical protein
LTGDFVRVFMFWLKIGASRFEFEPTPTFNCSSQMELAWSHDRRMFLAPDTVGGVEIPAWKSGRGIVPRSLGLDFFGAEGGRAGSHREPAVQSSDQRIALAPHCLCLYSGTLLVYMMPLLLSYSSYDDNGAS